MGQVLCPFVVGREHELRMLEAAWDDARAGRGSCVVLSGEAGIGKSRLARETIAAAGSGGGTALVGRAVPGSVSGYRPLTEALLQATRGREPVGGDGLSPWLPALEGITAVAGADATPAASISPALRAEAVLRLLAWRARPAGLLLVLEDLHWADGDTLAIVEYLADNLAEQPLMCVLTIRSDEPSPALDVLRRLRGRPAVTHLELDRLTPAQVAEMVGACAPHAGPDVLARVEATSEGVPLMVEEVLASPTVPRSFAEAVHDRLARLDLDARTVLEAAAVMGRHFEWQLLAPTTGLPAGVVAAALGAAVGLLLLSADDDSFRFRHALTREAVLETILPPRRQELAAAGLRAIDAAHPQADGPRRDLLADLAVRCGDRGRAARLLTEAGRGSLQRGALATAADTLRRAVELSDDASARVEAGVLLVEALALAGRVDEAASAAREVLGSASEGAVSGAHRVEVHLLMAHAAVAAARWATAVEHLDAARELLHDGPPSAAAARVAVLDAEVALARGEMSRAHRRAADAIDTQGAGPEVTCHALEVIGRVERLQDLPAARDAFERALGVAEQAGLAVWRLRALHELGTIEMFDHLGFERLVAARRGAEEVGALGTAAVVDLQLAAVSLSRWSPGDVADHARAALGLAQRLGLAEVQAKALLFLAESHALRAETEELEHHMALALAGRAGDASLEGFCWGVRGEAALVSGDREAAVEHLGRATSALRPVAHAEPAAFRALWPLVLASVGDPRARPALDEARRLGVDSFSLNRGLLGYAEAVVELRSGASARSEALADDADRRFVNAAAWRDLARLLAADAALQVRTGPRREWLAGLEEGFSARGLPELAAWSRRVLAGPPAEPLGRFGLTARELEVLDLVAQGLANKEIASRLQVSVRTVEKHVEALLRKTYVQSRTQLAVLATKATPDGSGSEL